jgi:hypothetical protein
MPMTLAGRDVAAASLVIDIDDVFDAMITPGPRHLVDLLQDAPA